jgi:hypothetical protein
MVLKTVSFHYYDKYEIWICKPDLAVPRISEQLPLYWVVRVENGQKRVVYDYRMAYIVSIVDGGI